MAQNGTPTEKCTPRQESAIVALLSSRNVAEAAQRAGIPKRTLFRWLASPGFKAHLHRAEEQLMDEVLRRLLGYLDATVTVQVTLMAQPEQPPAIRLRAACALQDFTFRLYEQREIHARLTALEEAFAQPTTHLPPPPADWTRTNGAWPSDDDD